MPEPNTEIAPSLDSLNQRIDAVTYALNRIYALAQGPSTTPRGSQKLADDAATAQEEWAHVHEQISATHITPATMFDVSDTIEHWEVAVNDLIDRVLAENLAPAMTKLTVTHNLVSAAKQKIVDAASEGFTLLSWGAGILVAGLVGILLVKAARH